MEKDPTRELEDLVDERETESIMEPRNIEEMVDEKEAESAIEERNIFVEKHLLEKKKKVLELLDRALLMKETRNYYPGDEQKEKWFQEAKAEYEKAQKEFNDEMAKIAEDPKHKYIAMEFSKIETLRDVNIALKRIEDQNETKKEAA